jgi:hypothetical protein
MFGPTTPVVGVVGNEVVDPGPSLVLAVASSIQPASLKPGDHLVGVRNTAVIGVVGMGRVLGGKVGRGVAGVREWGRVALCLNLIVSIEVVIAV